MKKAYIFLFASMFFGITYANRDITCCNQIGTHKGNCGATIVADDWDTDNNRIKGTRTCVEYPIISCYTKRSHEGCNGSINPPREIIETYRAYANIQNSTCTSPGLYANGIDACSFDISIDTSAWPQPIQGTENIAFQDFAYNVYLDQVDMQDERNILQDQGIQKISLPDQSGLKLVTNNEQSCIINTLGILMEYSDDFVSEYKKTFDVQTNQDEFIADFTKSKKLFYGKENYLTDADASRGETYINLLHDFIVTMPSNTQSEISLLDIFTLLEDPADRTKNRSNLGEDETFVCSDRDDLFDNIIEDVPTIQQIAAGNMLTGYSINMDAYTACYTLNLTNNLKNLPNAQTYFDNTAYPLSRIASAQAILESAQNKKITYNEYLDLGYYLLRLKNDFLNNLPTYQIESKQDLVNMMKSANNLERKPDECASVLYDTNKILDVPRRNEITTNVVYSVGGESIIKIDNITSIVPFDENQNMNLMARGGKSDATFKPMSFSNVSMAFKDPIVGKLELKDGEALKIGTEHTVQLVLNDVAGILNYAPYGGVIDIDNFTGSLNPTNTTNYEIQLKQNGQNFPYAHRDNPDKYPQTDIRLGYINPDIPLSEADPAAIITTPNIGYNIQGHYVRYGIENNDEDDIIYSNIEFMGVRIIGHSQAEGKQYITLGEKDITNISKPEEKNNIRKNAFQILRGLNPGVVENGVLYYEGGDKELSTINLDGVQTLIIKNGNLIIDQNIENLLGIIMLRDELDNKNLANVFIKPDVTYINAIIYGDGGFISLGGPNQKNVINNVDLYKDSVSRTADLQKQLVLKGSLITDNTVGGAIGAAGSYILPDGSTTSNFDLAMMYDLNYIRRNNRGWTEHSDLNEGYDDAFVIIYDPALQLNPPKGF